MVRTISEDPCTRCGRITNHYDPNMGRICPQCCAQACADFGKSLEFQYNKDYLGLMQWAITGAKASLDYLAELNKHLLTKPLIDHSNDIDAYFQK